MIPVAERTACFLRPSAGDEAGCTFLLSEDMQLGFVARGLTIVTPSPTPTHGWAR